MLSSLFIVLLLLSVSYPVPIRGMEAAMEDINHSSDHRLKENEIPSVPMKREVPTKVPINKPTNQSDDEGAGDYPSNIPSPYRKYIPHDSDRYQPSSNESGGGMGQQQNGGNYQKYIPDEYKRYAKGQGEAKKSEHEMVERTEYHHKGEAEQQGEEPWRDYIPAPYRKYIPSNIPSDEDQHHIHHHEKHHKDHHEDEQDYDKKDEKQSKIEHDHHEKAKHESKKDHEKKKHHHHPSHDYSEKADRKSEKDHHHSGHHHIHEKKHDESRGENHQKLFESSEALTDQEAMNRNIPMEPPGEEKSINDDNNSGGSFFSSVWMNIVIGLCVVIFAWMIYYLIVNDRLSSIYRRSKERKQIIVDDEIGRIPATAMEKSHLLEGEIRIYHQLLKDEPAMHV